MIKSISRRISKKNSCKAKRSERTRARQKDRKELVQGKKIGKNSCKAKRSEKTRARQKDRKKLVQGKKIGKNSCKATNMLLKESSFLPLLRIF